MMWLEGRVWMDEVPPVMTPGDMDILVTTAVTEYVGNGFFYVEGDEIVFNVVDPLDNITKRADLRDALEWDLFGNMICVGPHKGSIGNTKARANLTKLKDVLLEMAKDIDEALAVPFVPDEET